MGPVNTAFEIPRNAERTFRTPQAIEARRGPLSKRAGWFRPKNGCGKRGGASVLHEVTKTISTYMPHARLTTATPTLNDKPEKTSNYHRNTVGGKGGKRWLPALDVPSKADLERRPWRPRRATPPRCRPRRGGACPRAPPPR